MISKSLIAYIYFKVGMLIEKHIDIQELSFTEKVVSFLDEHLKEYPYTLVDKNYFFKKAYLLCEEAESLHNRGKEYENMLNLSIYLEDTFNDNSNHFGLSLERYFINTGKISNTKKIIMKRIKADPNQVDCDRL